MNDDLAEVDSPDFIERRNLADFSDDQIDLMLEQIRERRLKPVLVYMESQELKQKAREADCIETLEKQLSMFAKEKERMDALLEKMELRALKIRAIRLEIDG